MMWCAHCRSIFTPGEVETHSMLFGASDNNLLCVACACTEEVIIEEKGTNDVPNLLSYYRDSTTGPLRDTV